MTLPGGHPGSFLYGPLTLALGTAPPALRPPLQPFALRACSAVARPGRELAVTLCGSRMVRIRVRDHLGPGGGLRLAGYLHVHDSGRLETSGQARVELAAAVRAEWGCEP